ncbi:MAG: hypothetical protein HY890_06330 [Deltaproteobacteria bacterium]|nr:hypothetical protein [Deltaproteobacteria bacterium]
MAPPVNQPSSTANQPASPVKLPQWYATAGRLKRPDADIRDGFVEKNLMSVASFMKGIVAPARAPLKAGLLQAVTPPARVAGVGVLVLSGAFTRGVTGISALIFLTLVIAVLSRVELSALFKRAAPAVLFTAFVSAPVFFRFFTPGTVLFGLGAFGYRADVTMEGVRVGGILIMRVFTMVSFSSLLFLAARERDFFSGLRGLGVPEFFVTALFMTFRYIFVFLRLVEETHLARKSRVMAPVKSRDSRTWFAVISGFMLERALKFSEEVNMAMISRGFTGAIRTRRTPPLKGADYLWLGFTSFVFFLSLGGS